MLLWLYSVSCHACRHLCGGHVNQFSKHPHPLPAVEVRHAAQRPAHADRLGQPGHGGLGRPVRAAGGERRVPRPQDLLSTGASAHDRPRDPRLRRRRHRRRRRRAAGRHRGPASWASAPPSCASRSWARPTPSWPRAARRRPWATCGPRTTGRCTSATPCAAARCSTTGAWPSSTPRRHPTASTSWSAGGRCSTGPRTGASSSATSAATATPAWPTWATAPASSSSAPCSSAPSPSTSTCSWSARSSGC